MHSSDYWYCLVGASPIPESGERVTVAIAFGNGKLVNLDFDDRLSRLQGLISADHRAIYASMLRQSKEAINHGLTLDNLGMLLGPQFTLSTPRSLQVEYSDRVVRALRTAYLVPLASPREQTESFLKSSLRKLDHHFREVDHRGVSYLRGRYSLTDLYEHKLDRYVTVKVPAVRRMIRGVKRDVLVNTLQIPHGVGEGVIDQHVARISRQFFAFRELEQAIEDHAGRKVKRVGIIQPLPANATREEAKLASWAEEVWHQDAEVLRPANSSEVRDQLQALVGWTRAA